MPVKNGLRGSLASFRSRSLFSLLDFSLYPFVAARSRTQRRTDTRNAKIRERKWKRRVWSGLHRSFARLSFRTVRQINSTWKMRDNAESQTMLFPAASTLTRPWDEMLAVEASSNVEAVKGELERTREFLKSAEIYVASYFLNFIHFLNDVGCFVSGWRLFIVAGYQKVGLHLVRESRASIDDRWIEN